MNQAIPGGMGVAATGMGPDPAGPLRRDRYREFRAARRHSSLVRMLRWSLPGAGVLTAALFVLSYIVSSRLPDLEGFGLALDAARLTREGIVMDHPRITGTTAKGQRFEVRSARAWQSPASPKIINFAEIEAEMGLEQGGEALLTAGQGVYDSDRETLTISGQVRVGSSDGYGVHAANAFVDFRKGSVQTAEPIVVESAAIRIEASGAVGDGGERRIEFKGPVRVTVKPRPEASP
jgi:lipopolysaccharide export system protein LptC